MGKFAGRLFDQVKEQYQKTGYHISTGLVTPAEIENIKNRLEALFNQYGQAYLKPFESSLPHLPLGERLHQLAITDRSYANSLLMALLTDSHHDPAIGEIFNKPEIFETVQSLVAPYSISGFTTRLRCCLSAFPTHRHAWHQDLLDETLTVGKCNTIRIACWVPLSDVDQETGALECIPGQYERPFAHDKEPGRRSFIPEMILPNSSRKILTCRAGDVVFLDRLLPHRTLPVAGGVSRWRIDIWVKCEMA